jgi:mannosyl-3-phosphoglycerate phosphatase
LNNSLFSSSDLLKSIVNSLHDREILKVYPMLIIFTDLDGTLLNQDDYRYDAALPIISKLKEEEIPLIAVTSKTRAEVETLRREIGLKDPFIVENGSGIFIPENDSRFNLTDTTIKGQYYLKQLGCTYPEARKGLTAVAQTLDYNLQGFGDLTAEDLVKLTGLSLEKAKLAQTRDFSEPFLTPPNFTSKEINDAVTKNGFKVVVGDRFSHLIGSNSGKGKAVNWLMANYHLKEQKITTIGLGNSPNDLAMLENVDIPLIIPGKKGVHQGLAGRGWQVAPFSGCQGWAAIVEKTRKLLET